MTLLFPIPGWRCMQVYISGVFIYIYIFWAKALQEGGGVKGRSTLSMGEEELLGDAVGTEILHFPILPPFFPPPFGISAQGL